MKRLKQNIFLRILLATLLIFVASGCGHVAGDSNFTLGEEVAGNLFIFSQNATLAERSSVDGSVIMLCCNLTVEGKVNGDVFLLTGNVMVNPQATVNGNVSVLSGNVSK